MKRTLAALLALSLLLLAGCAKKTDTAPEPPAGQPPVVEPAPPAEPEPPEEPEPPADEETVYTLDGVTIPVPTDYKDLLIAELRPEAWNAHWTPLIAFWHRASVEAFNRDYPDAEGGVGWVATISRLDRIGFEDFISGGETGVSLFAKDDADRYYVIAYPTDVPLYGEDDDGWMMLAAWANGLPQKIVERNDLIPCSERDLVAAAYTYDGEHVELGCRFPGEPMDLCVLSLSQPAKQGEGGIWCVERVQFIYSDYSFTDLQLVFPVALGFDETAADYYARLQAECDAGEHPELLTPRGAALDYAKRSAWLFGEDVSETDFELIDAVG